MIPLRDENRSNTTPHVTRILLLINIVIFIPFLFYTFFPLDRTTSAFVENLFFSFVMVPQDILRGINLHTLVTSMFLHVDLFHIGGNMLFLYIFGDNVEDAFGHLRFLVFYLVCGLIADMAHILSLTSSAELLIPTLGASGAISGVLGAYILLYPRAKVLTLILVRLIWIVRIPAMVFIGFWFLLQLLFTFLGISGGVAYWAHIGGFIAGVVLAFVAQRLRPAREATPTHNIYM